MVAAEPREDVDHQRGAVLNTELAIHALQVRPNCRDRDIQLLSDLLIAIAFEEHLCDLGLPRWERQALKNGVPFVRGKNGRVGLGWGLQRWYPKRKRGPESDGLPVHSGHHSLQTWFIRRASNPVEKPRRATPDEFALCPCSGRNRVVFECTGRFVRTNRFKLSAPILPAIRPDQPVLRRDRLERWAGADVL